MRLSFFVLLLVLIVSCEEQKRVPKNPAYSVGIESKIERVMNNLQVETPEGAFVSKTLAERMQHMHTPGVSIAVINYDQIEWARGFGFANESPKDSVGVETLFQAGSVSKPVFALTVMKLKQANVVDLDRDVNEYLTSWKVPMVEGWQPKITLRQLLSHTAGMTVHGFPGYLKTEPLPTVPQILNGESPANTGEVTVNLLPGTAFRYSGGGTTIAQLLITDVLKKPFPQIMREELFFPLELPRSTYQQPLPDSIAKIASTAYPYKGQPINGRFHVYPEMAAAGLWTNPSELAKILMEVQRGVKGESTLFKKETIVEMLTPQKAAPTIGIGFFLDGQGDSIRFSHSGWDEGFVALAVAYKDLGKGAVIMVNSNEGYDLLDEICRSIAIEYKWPGYVSPEKKQSPFAPGEAAKIAGTFKSENNQIKLEAFGDELLSLIYDGMPPLLLVKMEDGSLKNRKMNFSIVAEKDVLKFTQEGKTTLYKRTAEPRKRRR